MQISHPQDLKDYLSSRMPPFKLRQDMILFYHKQVPMTAVWLIGGSIRMQHETGRVQDFKEPGLYFFEEMSSEKCLLATAILRAQSEAWFVSRSEINAYLLSV